MKNVLHGFILQEINNINREYCLPLSKGLQQFLQDHLNNVSSKMLNREFTSEISLLRYADTTLEQVPRTLRESFDEHVCRIGESIENNLEYARMFSSDLALKIQEANECATQYQDEKISMNDREMIMGALSHLLAVPKQRNEIMIRLKLMESKLTAQMMMLKGYRESIRFVLHELSQHSTYRRTVLETPSGFAIFDGNEDVFRRPQPYLLQLCSWGFYVLFLYLA
uniref:Uncharacterized protein n=1 Tax=Setaria viridis TaxID=4556 RepID=A0A4U6SVM3_SETVI|nr:hypothetical protein SEVIR_9G198100v2 [Setaria viridis]